MPKKSRSPFKKATLLGSIDMSEIKNCSCLLLSVFSLIVY
jgi:hypothetical protein